MRKFLTEFIKKLSKTINVLESICLKSQTLSSNRFTVHLFSFLKYLIHNLPRQLIQPKLMRELKLLKNSKIQLEGLLLANGPSLKKLNQQSVIQSQKELQIEVVCLNYFVLSQSDIKPNMIVLSDPETRPNENLERTVLLWDWIAKNPSTILFCPSSWSNEIISLDIQIIKNKIYYFNDAELFGVNRRLDPTKPRSYVSSTALKALSIMIFLNYKSIFFLGIDNDNFRAIEANLENDLLQPSHHFFKYSSHVNLTQQYGMDIIKYLQSFIDIFIDIKKFLRPNIFNLDTDSLIPGFKKLPKSIWLS